MKHFRFIFTLVFYSVSSNLYFAEAQKDTEFWFVAPELSVGVGGINYDRPVAFQFSTYDAPATITISQPANPGFTPQTISIGASASGFVQFADVDNFENKPPSTVLNYGFLITSTAPITAYYEIISGCFCNPEVFPLKGKNALGTEFYIPFQTYLENSATHTPLPHSAFDIVATEDNTIVTIIPTQDIVGHAANTQFSVTLQKGQTWSGEAAGQGPSEHPSGTKVTANKPIAITMKDDLVVGYIFGGFCRDLLGDQVVPVNRVGTTWRSEEHTSELQSH